MGRAALLPHNYPQLQNLIKRDPTSYREEFLQQYRHFEASMVVLQTSSSVPDERFESLVTFISHVSALYEESKTTFPTIIMNLLSRDAIGMTISLRKTLIQCLLLLRKHNSIKLVDLLELFVRLLRIQDKSLRELLYQSIVGEIRRANRPHKNNSLNRTLQNLMGNLFEQGSVEVGDDENLANQKILQIIIELYRKRIWDDTRTVNVIAEAATGKTSCKVMTTALNFFVGRFRGKALMEEGIENDSSEDDDETQNYQNLLHASKFNAGKKRSTQKKLKKVLNALHRKTSKNANHNGLFAAIHLLNDPQGFVERLFAKLRESNESFDTKLLLMNVISRVIGAHKLLLLEFYSFLYRYIQPHQREVTQILAYTAQAVHDRLPHDMVLPVIQAIVHNFVAEYCANEVIAAGINGIREICARCPEAMTADLLQDLSNFKGYQDKGVVMATRSLISLYREVSPELLHRRDRGKDVSIAMKKGKAIKRRINGDTVHLDAMIIKTSISCQEAKEQRDGEPGKDSGSAFSAPEQDFDPISKSDAESEADVNESDPIDECPTMESNDIVRLASQKILSPEETSLLRRHIYSHPDESSSEEYQSDYIDPRTLESSKKKKQDYEARMASIEAGRQDRPKYGSKKGKHNDKASISNRIKEKKTKNAIMLIHKSSVRAKKRRSLREKQQSLLAHRKRQKIRR